MSQASLILPNTGTLSGLALVNEINAALAAVSSQSSGATDPATLIGGVQTFSFWVDGANLLKMRNGANTAWLTIGDATQIGLGLASSATVQSGSSISAVAGGTANAITFTLATTLTNLTNGQPFVMTAATANTGAVTLVVTLGTTAMPSSAGVKGNNQPLVAGDIPGAGYPCLWNWSQGFGAYVLQNPATGITAQAAGGTRDRQTVQYGVMNSSGYANMLSAGTGLSLNLSATATPMRTAFAQGALDFIATLSADTTGVVTGLPANNLSFITQDYVSPTSVTWGSTLVPRQVGNTYDQSKQSSLPLNNSLLDDFGNIWTPTAITYSNTAPAIAGTFMAVFNGTTSKIVAPFNYLGSDSWTIRKKIKPSAIGSAMAILTGGTNSQFVLQLGINAAGKIIFFASSNLSSYDIANGATGTTTLVAGTSYDIELTCDAIAGKYFVYVSGVLDITVTSALKMPSQPQLTLGMYSNGANIYVGSIQAFEFLPYCKHPNGTNFTPPTTLPNIASAGYAGDWENKSNDTVNQVSGPSTAAGINPSFTVKNRVYVGEATAGATTISSVVNYALQGKYVGPNVPGLPSYGVQVSANHNIGSIPKVRRWVITALTNYAGYLPGQEVQSIMGRDGNAFTSSLDRPSASRNSAQITTGNSTAGLFVMNPSTGYWVDVTSSVAFSYRFECEKG